MNNKAPIFLENNKFLRIILKLYIQTLISKTIIKVRSNKTVATSNTDEAIKQKILLSAWNDKSILSIENYYS